jgi:methanogenic corrinoid protein MtbC1
MAKIGELWEQNRIEIFQEHLATEAIRSLLAALTALMPPPWQQSGRTALVSWAPGDEHELIPLALSAYLEIRGWLVKNLGGSLPAEQIVCAGGALNPDTLFLTCSMLSRLDEVLEVIEHIRSMPGHCRVVVGGHAAVFAGAVLENKDVLVAYDFEHGHRLALEEP